MSQADSTSTTRALSLGIVKQATIRQFERTPGESADLYRELFAQNEALALWIRRRSTELNPDIDARDASTTLALELIGIINNQLAINRLLGLVGDGTSSDKTPK